MELNIEKYILKPVSLFDVLPEDEKRFVEESSVKKKYKKRQELFNENSHPKGVFFIEKGKVKTYQTDREGKESIVNIYKKGDYLGYGPLLADEFHQVSSSAISEVEVAFITSEAFLELLSRSASLSKKLLSTLAQEISVFTHKTTVFSRYPVKERVALALLILSLIYRNEEESEEETVILINRDDFAAFVGAARETVVRVLRVFKNEGVISAKGTKIRILRPELLTESLMKKEEAEA